MKFSIKDLFGKCDQIHSVQWNWSHLLKESLIENLICFAVKLKLVPGSFLFLFRLFMKKTFLERSKKILLFPEMWVMKKIFTWAAAKKKNF